MRPLTTLFVSAALLLSSAITGCGGGGSTGDDSGSRGNQILIDAPGPGTSRDNTNRIVFVSGATGNQEIYSANPDGTDVLRLTDHPFPDTLPVWSPDRTKIAFNSQRGSGGGERLFVMNADGSDVHQVAVAVTNLSSHQWTPDSTQIVVGSNSPEAPLSGVNIPSCRLHVVNAQTGEIVREITSATRGVIRWLAVSPDGLNAVFSGTFGKQTPSDSTFFVRLSDGGGLRQFPSPPTMNTASDWSPAGGPLAGRVLVNYSGTAGAGTFALNPDSADATDVRPVVTGANGPVRFSPDGTQVAYTSDGRVMIANSDGAGAHALGDYDASSPDW